MSQATTAERYFLTLVNNERTARGLAPLTLETRLNESAEVHSRWMLQNNSFTHIGQDGSRARDRAEAAGFPLEGDWRATENLAYYSNNRDGSLMDEVRHLHSNLMDSSSHRAAILDPNVTFLGIGLEVGTFNGHPVVMATQDFARTFGPVERDIAPGVTVGTMSAPQVSAPEFSQAAWLEQVGKPHRTPFATSAADLIVRGPADDSVSGGAGDDWIAGGAGNDVLRGGLGNDNLLGQAGDDRLFGEIGDDRLWGGGGHDTLVGGAGQDVLMGGVGRDRLFGGAGNDLLQGGLGDDSLNGDGGNDTLVGGPGNDQLRGGAGADQFVFSGRTGTDRIMDFQSGTDRILIDADLVPDVTDFVLNHIHETATGVVIDLPEGQRIILADPDLSWRDVADDIFLF